MTLHPTELKNVVLEMRPFWVVFNHSKALELFCIDLIFKGTLMESAKQVCTELFMAELTLVTLFHFQSQKRSLDFDSVVLYDSIPKM